MAIALMLSYIGAEKEREMGHGYTNPHLGILRLYPNILAKNVLNVINILFTCHLICTVYVDQDLVMVNRSVVKRSGKEWTLKKGTKKE